MRQRIEQVRIGDGTPVAYATAGAGPPLVVVPGWLSSLEDGWAIPEERGLYEALAPGRTLVRYDRPGCGLSGPTDRTDVVGLELDVLDAVTAAVGGGRVDVLGSSLGAPLAVTWAVTRPQRVDRLVLYGGWVRGADLATPAVQEHVLGLVGEHWGLGSDLLTDLFAPDAGPGLRATIAAYQRHSAPAGTARRMLEEAYRIDVTDLLGQVRAPTAVLHRVQDRAAPLAQGRLLAAGIRGASFTTLPGRSHLLYVGDVTTVVGAIREALGLPPSRGPVRPRLTARQVEVAALVAAGCSNREIGTRLVITERSAESHVERILTRLGLRSRAQIATWYTATAAGAPPHPGAQVP